MDAQPKFRQGDKVVSVTTGEKTIISSTYWSEQTESWWVSYPQYIGPQWVNHCVPEELFTKED
jgi:hypothetical protein